MRDRTHTVSSLIREVNQLLDQAFPSVIVEGELSDVSRSARGHVYFRLKDAGASVDGVIWAAAARRLRFELEDGLAVLATGSLTVYPQRGRFQLVAEQLEPQGVGALQLAFEQLKRRLGAEGLFAEERKRPLPELPQRVGVVTSATGAALQDMLKVLRRHRRVSVVLAHAQVQGEAAAGQIADALGRLGASGLVDLIVLARGGGSLEDLWSFNEERVARAIAACPVPVVTGIGHEVDFTIADFVADLRAATPTHAAELVVAAVERQERRLAEAGVALSRELRRALALARSRLTGLEGSSGLARVPQRVRLAAGRLERAHRLPQLLATLAVGARRRVEGVEAGLRRLPALLAAGGHRRLLKSRRQQLAQLIGGRLSRLRATLAAGERALGHLSPQRVLERGYSITRREGSSSPLRDAAAIRPGLALCTTLARGEIRSVVAGRSTLAPPAPPGESQPSLFDPDDKE